MTWLRRCAVVAASASVLLGCGSAREAERTQVTVYAASSLVDVLPRMVDTRSSSALAPRWQFAGSDQLATQITEGAPADVFVSASTALPERMYRDGLVGKPVEFATNRIVLIVADGSTIDSFGELAARRSARIVMAQPGVPLGDYTRRVLADLDAGQIVGRARSLEHDAKAVTAKVAIGEADAGFVYVTDARAAGRRTSVVELPASRANRAVYAAAVVTSTRRPRAARRFLRQLTTRRARAALVAAGFGLP